MDFLDFPGHRTQPKRNGGRRESAVCAVSDAAGAPSRCKARVVSIFLQPWRPNALRHAVFVNVPLCCESLATLCSTRPLAILPRLRLGRGGWGDITESQSGDRGVVMCTLPPSSRCCVGMTSSRSDGGMRRMLTVDGGGDQRRVPRSLHMYPVPHNPIRDCATCQCLLRCQLVPSPTPCRTVASVHVVPPALWWRSFGDRTILLM